MTDNDATKRRNLMENINGTLAEIDSAKRRIAAVDAKYEKALLDMKSEKGTAEALLDKSVETYAKLKDKLDKMLPALVMETVGTHAPRPILKDITLPGE